MKKFLAIILSVMMILSAFSVASFAFYEEDLPVMPEQTEGRIYFAAENTYVEPGQTYNVPVYMISDYKTDIQEGFVELGFEFYLATNVEGAVVNGVEFADGIKAVKDFYPIEAHYGYTADEINEESDQFISYHTSTTSGYVAFAAGLEALNQTKVQVATVSITVPATLTETDQYISLNFKGYNFGENPFGFYFFPEEEGKSYNGGIFEGAIDASYFAEDFIEERLPEVVLVEGTTDGGEIFFSFGYMVKYDTPPQPTWLDKIIDWVQVTVEGILQVFETIHEYIRTALPLLDKISL